MPTPRKSYLTLVEQGTSHYTKEKLEKIKTAQEGNFSYKEMKPSNIVKSDKLALMYFKDLKYKLSLVNRDDLIWESAVNRLASLYAQEERLTNSINKLEELLDSTEEVKDIISLQQQINNIHGKLGAIQNREVKLESELGMTIQSAMRLFPVSRDDELDGINIDDFILHEKGE